MWNAKLAGDARRSPKTKTTTAEKALAVTAFLVGFGVAGLTQVRSNAALGPNLRAPGAFMAPVQNSPLQIMGNTAQNINTLSSVNNSLILFPNLQTATSQSLIMGPSFNQSFTPGIFDLQVPAFDVASMQPQISDDFMKLADANFYAPVPDFSDPRNNPSRVSSSTIR